MDNEEKRDDAGQGAPSSQGRSLDDLKAKLGIQMKPKAAESQAQAAQPAKPKVTSAQDFAFTLNQPVGMPQEEMPEETSEMRRLMSGAKKIGLWTILAYAGAVVAVLVVGLYFGRIMRERTVENFKTKEAKYVLDYFLTAKPGQPGIEEPVLKVVEAHIEDAMAVYQGLQKAGTDEARMKAEDDLMAFLKRCQAFREKKAAFTFEGAFPGFIFNQELAAQVMQFVYAVEKVYDETAFIALEADTLDRVQGLEDKEGLQQTFLVEPIEKDGKKLLEFKWLAKVDLDAGREGKDGQEFPALPLGEPRGFWVPEKSLIQFDIGPIAKMKTEKYKGAIKARVQGRLALIKAAGEQVAFPPLKDKLEKTAARSEFFSIF